MKKFSEQTAVFNFYTYGLHVYHIMSRLDLQKKKCDLVTLDASYSSASLF